ncbi:ABC transporter permease [Streptomyces qinzhouensis]|uniref:ABC transporter permease n=1 Tax=Streptomyces qinzhouensis TaxID=2599401 RepID=A0A5B8JB21_9ACTN|nr:ABC transporter permease [Streptomyces qinzhouensis]QDY77654.1 ABC transporter permease [Streptomyces qinzhouensis]
MSTAPASRSASVGYAGEIAVRVRFRDPLLAEWLKFWSLRSTYAVLAGGALTVTGINVNSARSNADRLTRSPEPALADPADVRFVFDPLAAAFTDPAWQLFMVFAASVGAAVVFGEYGSGLIRTTFTAVPARRSVAAAKLTVVTGVALGYGAVVSGASFGLTQAILRDHRGLSVADPGALRAVVASALLAPVCALVGMALAALVRHPAGSVGAVVGVLVLMPGLFNGDTYRWVREIGNALPVNAWRELVKNPERAIGVAKYPVTPLEAWLTFGGWALVAGVLTVVLMDRREV